MPVYYYKVGREDGSVLTKEVEAENEEILRKELEDAGLLVLQLTKRRAVTAGFSLPGRGRLKTEDFLVFNQELLVLIRAGLPIVQSLDILSERTLLPTFKDALADVKTEVRGGKALSDSMARHPRFFPELFTNSLRAGERTGNLPEVIERYIEYQKKMIAVKRQIKSATTYPIFLLGFTLLLLAFLLTYVVPTFTQIYAETKASLPLPTLVLMNTTQFLKRYILVFIAALVGLAFAFRAWYRTEDGRRRVDGYLLRMPMVGKLISGYTISTIARTLATILSGGIPMLQALEMVARSVTNREVSLKLRHALERVREGISLAGALEETGIMPPMTIRMIEVGEATGALEIMLNNISTFFEEETNTSVARITTLIEPLIMVTMGLVVGSVVVVMYLPIFELAGTIK